MIDKTNIDIQLTQNANDSVASCVKHMSQLDFYAQDHAELNQINEKQHDTIIFENIELQNGTEKEKEIPLTMNKNISLGSSNQDANKAVDGDKKKTLAQLRIQRIKVTNQFSKELFDAKESTNIQLSQFQKNDKEPRRIMLALNLLVSVKSFYRQVTKNTRIFQRLTQQQHEIIGDIASVYKRKQITKYQRFNDALKIIAFFFQRYLPTIPSFSPYSSLKRLWDLFNAILIIILTFFISLQVFFTLQPQEFRLLNKMSLIVFVIDIFLNFNTGIIDKGNLIDDRKKIAFIYLKNKFIYDFIGTISFFFIFLNLNTLKLSFVLFLLKWFSLKETFERLTFYLNYQKNLKNIVDLVKLILLLCVICHVFCGFWHALALYEISQGSNKTWLHTFNLEEANIFSRYVISFYYLAVTMITVGYGDITPQNTTEIIFTILTMFVTGITWGFSINKIGNIIDNIERKDKSYRESMQVVHTLMREENIASDLRDQISNYLKYLYNESNEVQKKQEQKVIDKLSNQLRLELISNIQGKYLENIPFINSMEQKQKIIFLMEECLFSPGETIFKEYSIDDCALYYIVKGEVEILSQSNSRNRGDSIIQILQKSSYFGEISFITGQPRDLTAKATDFCRIYKINREKFLNLVKENNKDYEELMMIRDNIIFKSNYSILNKKCFYCSSEEHFAMKCPKTHLVISKKGMANRYSFSIPHMKRLECERNRMRRRKTLLQCKELFQAVYRINDNEEFFDFLNEIEQKSKLNKNSTNNEFDQEESEESNNSFIEDENQINQLSIKEECVEDLIHKQLQRRNGLKVLIKQGYQEDSNRNQLDSPKIIQSTSSFKSAQNQEIINIQQDNSNILNEQLKSLEQQISNLQVFMQAESSINRQLSSINKLSVYNIPSNSKLQSESPKSSTTTVRKSRKSLSVGQYQMNSLQNNSFLDQNKQQPNNFPSQKLITHQNDKSSPDPLYKFGSSLNVGQEQFKSQLSHLSQQNDRSINEPSQNNKQIKHSILKQKTKSNSRLESIQDSRELKEFYTNNQVKKYESINQMDFSKQISINFEQVSPRLKKHIPKKATLLVDSRGVPYRIEPTTPTMKTLNPQSQHKQFQKRQSNQFSFVEGSYFMLQHFDKGHIFKYYYPKFNYTQIVKKLKKLSNLPNQEFKVIKKIKSIHAYSKFHNQWNTIASNNTQINQNKN